MLHPKKITAFIVALVAFVTAHAQPTQFSLATDVSVLRSFKETQQYWAIGQTVKFHFNFMPKDGAYAWLAYFADGKFVNGLTAIAKSPTTTPQQIDYFNGSALRFEHISLGWQHYLHGKFNSEYWNLYAYGGFGLMIGRVVNTPTTPIDTSMYHVEVLSGKGHFKRLTFDLGLGAELSLSAAVYMYLEARAMVPTTYYPSPYLLVNYKAPFTGAGSFGFRILFD